MGNPITRICNACGEEKPLTPEYWYQDSNYQGGFRPQCKACRRQVANRWTANNPEKIRAANRRWRTVHRDSELERGRHWRAKNIERVRQGAYQWQRENAEKARAYRAANADKIRERSRRWQAENPDRFRSNVRAWQAANPDKVKAQKHRRRARQLNLPNTLTDSQIQAAYLYFNNTCAICGNQLRDLFGDIKPHLDHWIALADPRPNNPGTVAANMLPLCSKCNFSKNDSDPIDWLNRKFGKRKATQILARVHTYLSHAEAL